MVTLEITNIHILNNVIVPFYNKNDSFPTHKGRGLKILQSKKYLDFVDWSLLVYIFYYGYHRLPEGISLIKEIQTSMNNYRLTTSAKLVDSTMLPINLNSQIITGEKNMIIEEDPLTLKKKSIESKMFHLKSLPSPYEIKNGIRYLRGTNNFVSDKLKLLAIDENNNKIYYDSISECSKALKIGRKNIKDCILSGKTYKNYKFIFDL
jgi:hypothetical protein